MKSLKLILLVKTWLCLFYVFCDCGGGGKNMQKTVSLSKDQDFCREKCYSGLNKCYKLCTGAPNIKAATKSCIDHGATILSIEFPQELRFISDLLEKEAPGKPIWHIGGKKIRGKWYWFSTIAKKQRRWHESSTVARRRKIKIHIIKSLRNRKMKCLTLQKWWKGDNLFRLTANWCRHRKGINFICQQHKQHLPLDETSVCGLKTIDHAAQRNLHKDMLTYKIIGGNAVRRGEIPWQARFYTDWPVWGPMIRENEGAAIIISEYWLLTAAHCLDVVMSDYYMRIVVGDHDITKLNEGEQVFEVSEIVQHPRYKHGNKDYDIALLMVKPRKGRGILFNQYVQPACLPPANATFSPGLKCTISGWGESTVFGITEDPIGLLRAATIPLVDTSVCKRHIPSFSKRRMVCAGFPTVRGVDTTPGDSGGPLVCPLDGVNTVLGITAFGVGRYGYSPGGYSNVQGYLSWIKKTIMRKSQHKKQRILPEWPKSGIKMSEIRRERKRETQTEREGGEIERRIGRHRPR
ncbi:chymotrypsin-like elastase family member 1 [Elysia marginata]|uniref:Chymotrypsin-like elastase family member 1 n=1 Tax=Elysia marginata TaxID=1093978 RepID=A0AAV4GPQ3_9GAST|nr:chymotrypsin-like elastase family member 1 [Elysia marginata]